MEYSLERLCKDCKNVDSIELTKIEAAFDLFSFNEIWNRHCSKCDSKNCSSVTHPQKLVDQELLDTWGYDLKLFFMEQDEEVILAEMQYFTMFLKAIDDSKYLERKINILIESICVLLYDNVISSEEYTEAENNQREKNKNIILPELIERKERVFKASLYIFDYIKNETFPMIGLKI